MVGAIAVFVDTKSLLIFAPGELKPVIEHAEGGGCGRLAERVVTVTFNNLAGKASQICDAAEPVLLKEITLTVRHNDIVGSQQDFVDPLAVQVPTCARPVGFPFVDGMRPVIGVIDRRSVEVSPDAAAQSIVSES